MTRLTEMNTLSSRSRKGKAQRGRKKAPAPDLRRIPSGVSLRKRPDGFSMSLRSDSRVTGIFFLLAGLASWIGAAFIIANVEGGLPGAVVLMIIGTALVVPGLRFLLTLYRITVSGPQLNIRTEVGLPVRSFSTEMAEVRKLGLRGRQGTQNLNYGYLTLGQQNVKEAWITLSTYSGEIAFGKLADPENLRWAREYLVKAMQAHQRKLIADGRLVETPGEKSKSWFDPRG